MSLTSYRAAPPRAGVGRRGRPRRQRRPTDKSAAFGRNGRADAVEEVKRQVVLGRPGNDLLSRVLRHSTIGAEEFNGRVRDGIGFLAPRSDHRTSQGQQASKGRMVGGEWRRVCDPFAIRHPPFTVFLLIITITHSDHESNQANRAISTSKLNTSPRLHTWPINVVVFHGSQGRTRFKGGFPLRCLQRLSRPYIATLHCGWRHNSSTRGTSIPVLSY